MSTCKPRPCSIRASRESSASEAATMSMLAAPRRHFVVVRNRHGLIRRPHHHWDNLPLSLGAAWRQNRGEHHDCCRAYCCCDLPPIHERVAVTTPKQCCGCPLQLPTDGSIATAAHAPGKAHESRVHNFIDSTGQRHISNCKHRPVHYNTAANRRPDSTSPCHE